MPNTTKSNAPKVELRSVKYFASMSEETPCYQANIYIDGQKVGEAQNRGFGGMTDIRPHAVETQLMVIAKTKGHDAADHLIDDLFQDWSDRNDLKKLLKNRVVFVDSAGEISQTKPYPPVVLLDILKRPNLKSLLSASEVLNLLSFEDALKVFCEKTTPQMSTGQVGA